MRFSVIIPAHNPDPEQLRWCLTSIVKQLPPDEGEVLLIDDASEPSLLGMAGEFPGVRHVATEGELFGLATTNLGLSLARGDLLQVVHPDDWVLPGFYATMQAARAARPGLALYAAQSLQADEIGRTFAAPSVSWLESERGFLPLHHGNPLGVAACCVTRDFYRRHGGWHADLYHCADWEYWCRATTLGGALDVHWPLAVYRHHGVNHTSRLMRTADNLRNYLTCAEVVAGYAPAAVDWPEFRRYVAARARGQETHFLRLGDEIAAEANRLLADSLEVIAEELEAHA